MALRINTNIPSITAQRYLGNSQKQIEHSLRALSSGSRIVQPGDDAAGLAISENLRGQVSGLKQARMNAENSISMVQVAEGGLNEQNNILIRLRELGVQAASDTVGDQERTFLNEEFQQLRQEFDRIAQTTQYGSKKLLTGDKAELEFHVGANAGEENIIRYDLNANSTASHVGITGLSITDKGDARDSLDSIDEALGKVAAIRADFGAIQSRIMSTTNNLDVQIENISAARGRIIDTDVAEETAKLVQSKVLGDIGTAVLAQTNTLPHSADRLLGVLM